MRQQRLNLYLAASLIGLMPVCAIPAQAEEHGALTVELNTVTQQPDGACRLTFVTENGLGTDIDGLVLETVIFSPDGQVKLLTLFDFQAVPVSRARVRQFDVPATPCGEISQILFNGVYSCTGGDLDAARCQQSLSLSSRIDTEVQG